MSYASSTGGILSGIILAPVCMLVGYGVARVISRWKKLSPEKEHAATGTGTILAATLLASLLDTSAFSSGIKVTAIAGSILAGSLEGINVVTTENYPRDQNSTPFCLNSIKWATGGGMAGALIATISSAVLPP